MRGSTVTADAGMPHACRWPSRQRSSCRQGSSTPPRSSLRELLGSVAASRVSVASASPAPATRSCRARLMPAAERPRPSSATRTAGQRLERASATSGDTPSAWLTSRSTTLGRCSRVGAMNWMASCSTLLWLSRTSKGPVAAGPMRSTISTIALITSASASSRSAILPPAGAARSMSACRYSRGMALPDMERCTGATLYRRTASPVHPPRLACAASHVAKA
mmetsp:Transcript_14174/g.36380  ORF Transcript_14174/g.36380 Transcript_14174/m.36380 type:complete len:221 (-) Transcript_14174:1057-1719(-)